MTIVQHHPRERASPAPRGNRCGVSAAKHLTDTTYCAQLAEPGNSDRVENQPLPHRTGAGIQTKATCRNAHIHDSTDRAAFEAAVNPNVRVNFDAFDKDIHHGLGGFCDPAMSWCEGTADGILRIASSDEYYVDPFHGNLTMGGGFSYADTDVWVHDVARGNNTKLTVDGVSRFPLWMSDGKKVTLQSNKAGAINLFWITADGTGEEQLTASRNRQLPGSSSPNGETLAFSEFDPTTQADIWTLSLKDWQRAQPSVRTPFNELQPAFSADGRWVAYQSDRSGQFEVYVQPFPGPGSGELVSNDGGTEPSWSRDGRELFYRNGDQMMAVATMLQPTFRASKPETLFKKPDLTSSLPRNYDVTSDGQRFLIIKDSQQVDAAIIVVMGWTEELKRLVPTTK